MFGFTTKNDGIYTWDSVAPGVIYARFHPYTTLPQAPLPQWRI